VTLKKVSVMVFCMRTSSVNVSMIKEFGNPSIEVI
jgi:hypothetical protein